jgi:hypothetical protein
MCMNLQNMNGMFRYENSLQSDPFLVKTFKQNSGAWMHYSVSSIAAYINSHSHLWSTFDLTCTFIKSMVWKVLFPYRVTNYFCSQNSNFGHMPLYITISVKSYNLLTWLFHISSYQNKTITLSRIWHLYLLYTVYHSIFELQSVLWSAMVKLIEWHKI